MKLNIKDLAVSQEVSSKGIEIEVRDASNKRLGDFHVTKTNLVWCPGKTDKKDGKKITWKKFIEQFDDK